MIDIWMFVHVFMLAVCFVLMLVIHHIHQRMAESDAEELKVVRYALECQILVCSDTEYYSGLIISDIYILFQSPGYKD